MSTATAKPLSMVQVLVCGAAIVTLSMGIRHGFGLWLQPVTAERLEKPQEAVLGGSADHD